MATLDLTPPAAQLGKLTVHATQHSQLQTPEKQSIEAHVLEELRRIAAKVDRLEEQLNAQAEQARAHALTQSLQWAISHAEAGQFTYMDGPTSRQSAGFVRDVLLGFMRGAGTFIPNQYAMEYFNRDPIDRERQAFRNALSCQIHTLTGVKPRITKEQNRAAEQFIVYRV